MQQIQRRQLTVSRRTQDSAAADRSARLSKKKARDILKSCYVGNLHARGECVRYLRYGDSGCMTSCGKERPSMLNGVFHMRCRLKSFQLRLPDFLTGTETIESGLTYLSASFAMGCHRSRDSNASRRVPLTRSTSCGSCKAGVLIS